MPAEERRILRSLKRLIVVQSCVSFPRRIISSKTSIPCVQETLSPVKHGGELSIATYEYVVRPRRQPHRRLFEDNVCGHGPICRLPLSILLTKPKYLPPLILPSIVRRFEPAILCIHFFKSSSSISGPIADRTARQRDF